MRAIVLLLLLCLPAQAMRITGYCSCAACCGKNAQGITASGKRPRQGITCAAPRNVPFGTKVKIGGVGTLVVQDRLAKSHDDSIDIYFYNHADAVQFGLRNRSVTYIRR